MISYNNYFKYELLLIRPIKMLDGHHIWACDTILTNMLKLMRSQNGRITILNHDIYSYG